MCQCIPHISIIAVFYRLIGILCYIKFFKIRLPINKSPSTAKIVVDLSSPPLLPQYTMSQNCCNTSNSLLVDPDNSKLVSFVAAGNPPIQDASLTAKELGETVTKSLKQTAIKLKENDKKSTAHKETKNQKKTISK